MSAIRSGCDPKLEHTRIRYRGIGRAGWYITTSTPTGAGATWATDGPFELDDLESRLAAIEGGSEEQDAATGQLPRREQVIEEGLISRVEAAALELAEKINARADCSSVAVDQRKKALEELMTASGVYDHWCDE